MSLTDKQKQVLNYIQTFIDTHKVAPSYEELQSYFGFASKSSVYRHLNTLKSKGLIQIQKKGSDKGIALIQLAKKTHPTTYSLPLLGLLNDEGEIEPIEEEQNFYYSSSQKLPQNCYLLKVKTGNFLEAGLLHQDLIVVEPRSEAKMGETILGYVYQERYIVKKYQPKGPYTRLDSFCVQIEPMIVCAEELTIQGVILGIIRNY